MYNTINPGVLEAGEIDVFRVPAGFDPRRRNEGNNEFLKDNLIQFSDASIRRAFVRKADSHPVATNIPERVLEFQVYATLVVMLSVNFGMCAAAAFSEKLKMWVITHVWVYIVSTVLFLVVYIGISCCTGCRRSFPGNVIALVVLTLSMSYMCMMISAYHKTSIVFLAMGICVVCCLAITLFSMNTKYDFTSWIGVIFVISIVLMLVGILAIILLYAAPSIGKPVYAVYAGLAALAFMVFLAVDTQMVMGGRQHEISEEDWVFAATQLFCDVVYIFIYLMEIMGIATR